MKIVTKSALADQSTTPPDKNPEGNNGRSTRIRLKPLKKDMDVSKDVPDLLYGVLRITKGGVGSGFHGHKGRPGSVGGSSNSTTQFVNNQTWYHATSSKSSIMETGFRKSNNSIFGSGAYFSISNPKDNSKSMHKEVVEATVNLNNVIKTEYTEFPRIYEELTGKKHFGLSGEEKLLQDLGYDGVYIEDEGWLVVFDPQEGIETLKEFPSVEKGGPGSGDWGHRGRPGLVGGSAEAGGFVYTIEGLGEGTTRHTISLRDVKWRRIVAIEKATQARTQALSVNAKKKKVLKDPPADYKAKLKIENFDEDKALNDMNYVIGAATRGGVKDIAQFVYNAYEFTDEESGYSSKVESLTHHKYDPDYDASTTVVEGLIYDKNGRDVATFRRVITEEGEVHNDYFAFRSENRQGSGFGAKFYKNAEETYLEAGIDNVTIYANIDVGGYAWARMGFDFKDDSKRQEVYENLVDTFAWENGRMSRRNAMDALEGLGITDQSKAWEFAAFTDSSGRRYGKDLLLGSSWNAIKKIDPTDESWLAGQAYYASKGL